MKEILFLHYLLKNPCSVTQSILHNALAGWKAQNIYFQLDPVITVLDKMEKCAKEIIWLLHAFLFAIDKVIASQISAD